MSARRSSKTASSDTEWDMDSHFSNVTGSSSRPANFEGMHVSVRIRPLSSSEILSGYKSCCNTMGDNMVVIKKDGDSSSYLKSQMSLFVHEYAFDAVFDERASQQDVYEKSAKKFVSKAMIGENVTIFAYGATGAGKSTMYLIFV